MTETDIFEQDVQEQMDPSGSKKVIKYDSMVGIEGARIIRKEDFAKAGIDHETAEWNLDNNFMLPASGFSEAAIELVLAQPNFRLLDA